MGLICGNCGKSLGCGCQVRTASNGKGCCESCIMNYEMTLNTNRTPDSFITPNNVVVNPNNTTPRILNISSPNGTIYNNLNT